VLKSRVDTTSKG